MAIVKRNPSAFVACAARNPIAKNKEKITPYRMDLVKGVSGDKSALAIGTIKTGNAIMNNTKRPFRRHQDCANTAPPPLSYVLLSTNKKAFFCLIQVSLSLVPAILCKIVIAQCQPLCSATSSPNSFFTLLFIRIIRRLT